MCRVFLSRCDIGRGHMIDYAVQAFGVIATFTIASHYHSMLWSVSFNSHCKTQQGQCRLHCILTFFNRDKNLPHPLPPPPIAQRGVNQGSQEGWPPLIPPPPASNPISENLEGLMVAS